MARSRFVRTLIVRRMREALAFANLPSTSDNLRVANRGDGQDFTLIDGSTVTMTSERTFGVRGFMVQRFLTQFRRRHPDFYSQALNSLGRYGRARGLTVLPIEPFLELILFVDRSVGRPEYENLWTESLRLEFSGGPFFGNIFKFALRIPADALSFTIKHTPKAWQTAFPGATPLSATLDPLCLTAFGGFGLPPFVEDTFIAGTLGAMRAQPITCGRPDIVVSRQADRDGTIRFLFGRQIMTTEEMPIVAMDQTVPVS